MAAKAIVDKRIAAEEAQLKQETETKKHEYTRHPEAGLERSGHTEGMSAEFVDLVDRMAKMLGVKVSFTDVPMKGEAQYWRNEIIISKDAREKTISVLLGHEMMHHMRDVSPELYADFMESVMAYMGKDRFAVAIASKMATYQAQGVYIDNELAAEEVCADVAGRLVDDEFVFHDFLESVDKRMERAKRNRFMRGLLRVADFLAGLVNKIGAPKEDAKVRAMKKALYNFIDDATAKQQNATDMNIEEKSDEAKYALRELDAPYMEAERAEIEERAKADGTWLKAPNGQPTNLTPEQWVTVRTKAFKRWFGDWEKAARIEKLRSSEDVVISGDEITSSDDMKEYRKNALEYGKTLRGEYVNTDTGATIIINKDSLTEVLHHDGNNVAHIQSVAAIPQMVESGIYITSEPVSENASKKLRNAKIAHYYVCGLNIGGIPHTVKFVVAEFESGERYYDHSLTEIEKGELLNRAELSSTVAESKTPISDIKDKRLISILQINSSKIVDANGEPMVVYHGTKEKFNAFIRRSDIGYHFGTKGTARVKAGRSRDAVMMSVFLNSRNPLIFDKDLGSWEADYVVRELLEKELITDAEAKSILLLPNGQRRNSSYANKDLRAWIAGKGYDSFVYPNWYESNGKLSYMVFDPNQIKSATDNVGTFDANNPDIRYSLVTERIENLFKEAVAGTVNGKPISIGTLTAEGKSYLEKISGLKFRDKVDFVLNPSDLLHIYKEHYGENEKDAGNNIPLNMHDIRRIIDVISVPERIVYGVDNKGMKCFFFLLGSAEGTYNLLEIYADGKGKMSSKTYYKTKKGVSQRVISLKNSLHSTSETDGATLSDAKIPQIFELPKIEPKYSLAYHGSGADFDAFDHSFMGSGEGSQAFGWGTYVTEDADIARDYAQRAMYVKAGVHPDQIKLYDNQIKACKDRIKAIGSYDDYIKKKQLQLKAHRADMAKFENINPERYYTAKRMAESVTKRMNEEEYKAAIAVEEDNIRRLEKEKQARISTLSALEKSGEARKLYRVDIPDDMGDNYIYWEEPVSDKLIDEVKSRYNDILIEKNTGGHLYRALSQQLGDKGASKYLNALGYVGIKYKAGSIWGWRNNDTYNYVIFNADDAKIEDKTRYSLRVPTDEKVTFDNFFESTSATYDIIPISDIPKRDADYTSQRWDGYGISSRYWYGEDERGEYVIRESDHWSAYPGGERVAQAFAENPYDRRYTRIGSCRWALNIDKLPNATISPKFEGYIDGKKMYGKAYLDEFTKWEENPAATKYSLREVNDRFNEELATLTEENKDNVNLSLGMPSDILLSAGVVNKPMKLYGAKVWAKAKKHGYNVSDLRDLPLNVATPIAIFKGSTAESHAVLTEIKVGENNVLATLSVGKGGEDIDFNIISSVYGKQSDNVIKWIDEGKLEYVDKEKALNYLHHSAPIAEALSNPRLVSTTKVIQNFENPKIEPKYSLSTEETEKIFSAAKEKFGTTFDMREAGYILPDGSMLDFSGRHQVRGSDTSFLNGDRTVDHRDIADIAYDFDDNETGVETDMGDFLDRGAIRIDYNSGAINLNVAPTKAQKDRLKRLVERNDGYVYVDFGKGWDTEHYAEYEAARPSRVLGDIDRYFDEGIKPSGNVKFSLRTMEDGVTLLRNKARAYNIDIPMMLIENAEEYVSLMRHERAKNPQKKANAFATFLWDNEMICFNGTYFLDADEEYIDNAVMHEYAHYVTKQMWSDVTALVKTLNEADILWVRENLLGEHYNDISLEGTINEIISTFVEEMGAETRHDIFNGRVDINEIIPHLRSAIGDNADITDGAKEIMMSTLPLVAKNLETIKSIYNGRREDNIILRREATRAVGQGGSGESAPTQEFMDMRDARHTGRPDRIERGDSQEEGAAYQEIQPEAGVTRYSLPEGRDFTEIPFYDEMGNEARTKRVRSQNEYSDIATRIERNHQTNLRKIRKEAEEARKAANKYAREPRS